MDAFQRGLQRGIPTEKAASFFVGLKSWQPLAPEDDVLMAECIKQAAADVSPAIKVAGLRQRLASIKQAAEESSHSNGAMSSPTPAEGMDEAAVSSPEQEYLANEQAGMAAEEQGSVAYYQQVMSQLREQLSQAQEAAQAAQMQADELAQQQSAHEQQMAGAQQEAQLAQSAALQQVQTANEAATQSMQQAVDAENRALQAKSQEAAAKIQQQQTRSQLFDLASQGLPGSEPELGGAGNAAEGMEPGLPPEQPQQAEGAPAASGGEAIPGAAEQGGQVPPATGETPNAGMNEAGQPANAEGMPGQNASAEDPGGAVGPAALQPPGDSSGGAGAGSGIGPQAKSDGGPTSVMQDPTAKRQGQVSIKVGSYQDAISFLEERQRRPLAEASKTAGFMDAAGRAMRNPEVAGGVAGGLVGLGLGGIEASGHGPSLDKLRGKIDREGAEMRQPGLKGFSKAFDLASSRAMLTAGEAMQSHPVLGTLASGVAGASMGAGLGHQLPNILREAAELHRGKPTGL